jgi:hypothetical protein
MWPKPYVLTGERVHCNLAFEQRDLLVDEVDLPQTTVDCLPLVAR